MYIANKYWNNYIGDTDDSLTLVEYLASKQQPEISVDEIFSDFGLDLTEVDVKTTDTLLTYADGADLEFELYYAIDLITDLAALLLECKKNTTVSLAELFGTDLPASVPNVKITAAPAAYDFIKKQLLAFAADPLSYDLSDMCPEEDMQEMAALCGELVREL